VTSAGSGNVNEIATSLTLWKDGSKIDTIDVSEGLDSNYAGGETGACAGTFLRYSLQ